MEMLNVVLPLYSSDWSQAPEVLAGLGLQSPQAVHWAQQLTRERGWRERVAAAKLVAIFALQDCVEPLVATFQRNPENYTCRAFHRMLGYFSDELAEAQRQRMQAWCLDCSGCEDYKQHLISILDTPPR